MTNENLNNFYTRFPGQYKRELEEQYGNGTYARQFADIDDIIYKPGSGFDINYFDSLMKRKKPLDSEQRELTDVFILKRIRNEPPSGEIEARIEELGRKQTELYAELNTLLEPVAQEMVKRGYKIEDLTH